MVGAVIPTQAAGSLFAGFMSVANLAYSFSYSSGAWLYEHGTQFGPLRSAQQAIFGISAQPGNELSVNMLILLGSLAYTLSFVCVHLLPDRRETLATEALEGQPGPERWASLSPRARRGVNAAAGAGGIGLFWLCYVVASMDPVSSVLITFFVTVGLRKVALDTLLGKRPQPQP